MAREAEELIQKARDVDRRIRRLRGGTPRVHRAREGYKRFGGSVGAFGFKLRLFGRPLALQGSRILRQDPPKNCTDALGVHWKGFSRFLQRTADSCRLLCLLWKSFGPPPSSREHVS